MNFQDQSFYLTRAFTEAGKYDLDRKLWFLARLPDSPFYRPDSNNETFRDTAVFCLKTSGYSKFGFAEKMNVPASLFENWMQSMHLPYPLRRVEYAMDMINIALHSHGWIGNPPQPPPSGGSNVISLKP